MSGEAVKAAEAFMLCKTTCLCSAIKHATTELRSLDPSALEEVGRGKPSYIDTFNLNTDGYRMLFYSGKGLPLSGMLYPMEIYKRYLAGKISPEVFEALSTPEAASLLFRARRG